MSPVLDTAEDAANSGMLSGMATETSPAGEPQNSRIPSGEPQNLRAPSVTALPSRVGSDAARQATISGAPGLSSETWVDPATTSCEASLCTLARTSASEPVLPEAQRRWAARSITERLQPIRKARHWIAAHPEAFAKAISPNLARSEADTLVTELLPLLEAMRFLERNARRILAPKKLSTRDRPLWLTGVRAEVHRDPLGHVLVVGPANFPLFLPGTQTIQALVAGNAVTWKPGTGGEQVAILLAHVLREAGLPRGILHVAGESVEAAQSALAQHPDKVVFTGSFETGRKILHTLAETATPAVMELSGADAVVVLPSADLPLAAKAIAFGLRLNGAEVCMSPRRLVGTRETLNTLRPLLENELATVPPIALKPQTARQLEALLLKSQDHGSEAFSNLSISPLKPEQQAPGTNLPATTSPILINATPDSAIARTDIFAPVLSVIEAPSVLHLPEIVNNNPYALTAAIFGDSAEAQTLAAQLRTGTVVINDLIAPTADPRVPFGGRAHSGFGVTRGAEGLLEMTASKTVLIRRKGITQHYAPLGPKDTPLFSALIGTLHAGTLGDRWQSLKKLIAAARTRPKRPQASS